jgi:hypothetical protein
MFAVEKSHWCSCRHKKKLREEFVAFFPVCRTADADAVTFVSSDGLSVAAVITFAAICHEGFQAVRGAP